MPTQRMPADEHQATARSAVFLPPSAVGVPMVSFVLPALGRPMVSLAAMFPVAGCPVISTPAPIPEAGDPDVVQARRHADDFLMQRGWGLARPIRIVRRGRHDAEI